MESSLFVGIYVGEFRGFSLPRNEGRNELSCIVMLQTYHQRIYVPMKQQNSDNLRTLTPINKDETQIIIHAVFNTKLDSPINRNIKKR